MSSDAPKGRGRGRGRRTAATTLSGATVSASPSPAPAERPSTSRASTTDGTATPAPEAVDDAPSGSERDDPAASRSKSSTPAAGAPSVAAPKPAVKRIASVGIGSTRAASVGLSRTPSIGGGAARERPVGGLLGSTSEFRPGASGVGAAKAKFRPNMKRGTTRAVESDDEDVKMEDDSNPRGKRGPRPPRAPRAELEMTASGPMAQGPGGPPRAWGPKAPVGNSGAAVMAASRAGTLNRMLDDDSDASDLEVDADPYDEEGGVRFKAVDLNDIGQTAEEQEGMTPLVLPRDPKVLRTKIRRLKERKVERAKKEARDKAKAEGRVKTEDGDDLMALDGTPGPSASATPAGSASTTPAPYDSKEGSLAVDDEKEAKDLKDLEEEEKKEIILSEAFEVAPEARGELYMFQFPRKFPNFVPSSSLSSASDALGDLSINGTPGESGVKPDPDAPAPRRKPTPPQWGRFGSRNEKAARWSEEAGRIGELCVHRSGKVTLRLNGDLRYEVLPAAQPSFLQEIAVIDHPAPKKGKSKHASSDESSSSSSDDDRSDASTSSAEARKKKKAAKKEKKRSSSSSKGKKTKPPPPDALVVLGQTSKKFLVVPEVTDLLDKVAEQERREKEEERNLKLAKAGLLKKEGGGRK
ncbi:hypothetical protein JCM8097_007266 [Rhodosporidiobolus ruineniae]